MKRTITNTAVRVKKTGRNKAGELCFVEEIVNIKNVRIGADGEGLKKAMKRKFGKAFDNIDIMGYETTEKTYELSDEDFFKHAKLVETTAIDEANEGEE